jgi:hypothetical protein
MPPASSLWNSISWIAGAILVIIFVYLLVRTASFAYFRTKLDFLRSARKEELRKDRNA